MLLLHLFSGAERVGHGPVPAQQPVLQALALLFSQIDLPRLVLRFGCEWPTSVVDSWTAAAAGALALDRRGRGAARGSGMGVVWMLACTCMCRRVRERTATAYFTVLQAWSV